MPDITFPTTFPALGALPSFPALGPPGGRYGRHIANDGTGSLSIMRTVCFTLLTEHMETQRPPYALGTGPAPDLQALAQVNDGGLEPDEFGDVPMTIRFHADWTPNFNSTIDLDSNRAIRQTIGLTVQELTDTSYEDLTASGHACQYCINPPTLAPFQSCRRVVIYTDDVPQYPFAGACGCCLFMGYVDCSATILPANNNPILQDGPGREMNRLENERAIASMEELFQRLQLPAAVDQLTDADIDTLYNLVTRRQAAQTALDNAATAYVDARQRLLVTAGNWLNLNGYLAAPTAPAARGGRGRGRGRRAAGGGARRHTRSSGPPTDL